LGILTLTLEASQVHSNYYKLYHELYRRNPTN